MERVLSYMEQKRETLLNDYKIPGREVPESCFNIAIQIAQLLRSIPETDVRILEFAQERYATNITPVMFDGRVRWSRHMVCASGGKVFDPLHEKPVSLRSYGEKTFGEKIPYSIYTDRQLIDHEILVFEKMNRFR